MLKFKKDLIWNYISLVIMAFTGLLMNTVIAISYGSETLGIFNETYAWYMVLSQLSVWGVHMAMVKFVPEANDGDEKGALLKCGLLVTVCISGLITVISEVVVHLLHQLVWQKSMILAFSGLIFFSLNKVLLSYLNAIYRMVSYAVFTSVRYASLGGLIVVFSIVKIQPEMLALIFPVTEGFVFSLMLVYYLAKVKFKGKINRKSIRDIMGFGTRILPSYMVLEMNTKVDIICLGLLILNVSEIGVYSFAILFTEGFYMLFIEIRKIINPHLSEANAEGKLDQKISDINGKLRHYIILGGIAAYGLVLFVYYIVCIVLNRYEYMTGLIYILIICFAIVINGKSIVYGDLLGQAGFPFEESLLNIVTVLTNIMMNVVLILSFGTIGAAIATAISYFVFSFYMRARMRKRIGVML